MKTNRLTLEKVRAIKKREKIHRLRRKNRNFAMLYGSDPKKLQALAGDVTVAQAEEILASPFAQQLLDIKGDLHSIVGSVMTGWPPKEDLDFHSFKRTGLRTGRIKTVPKIH